MNIFVVSFVLGSVIAISCAFVIHKENENEGKITRALKIAALSSVVLYVGLSYFYANDSINQDIDIGEPDF